MVRVKSLACRDEKSSYEASSVGLQHLAPDGECVMTIGNSQLGSAAPGFYGTFDKELVE
jgi:hypothetical protein